MAKENMELVVDTGSVLIDIKDKNGRKLGDFEFVPTDSNILKRYEDVAKKLEEIEVPDGLSAKETAAKMQAISEELEKQVDYLLGSGAAKRLFSVCGALTVVSNGDFFIENVLEGIGDLIGRVFDQRQRKKVAKLKRATAEYHK